MGAPLTCPLPHVVVERDSRADAERHLSLSPLQGERLGEGVCTLSLGRGWRVAPGEGINDA